MITINKTDISITRGDSAYITFSVTDSSGNRVTLGNGDLIRCQVRDKNIDGDLIFEGDISVDRNNNIVWHIKPENTTDCVVGTYYWDAQIEYSNGDVYTFINISKFNILPEITMVEDD